MAKPKLFVSHSTKDNAFTTKLVNDLNAAGAQAWMDANDLGAGNFQERISQALVDCEWFLLVLTRNALASNWVRQEVDAANRLKNQGRIKDLIFIKAGDVDHHEVPALWGVFNVFDATADYAAMLDRTLKAAGIAAKRMPSVVSLKRVPSGDSLNPPVITWDNYTCPECGAIFPNVLRNTDERGFFKCDFCGLVSRPILTVQRRPDS